jgi:hypothetical protein
MDARKLIELENKLPIFFHYDWLNIICGKDNWKVIYYKEKEEVVGVFTYYLSENRIMMPKLAVFMGGILIDADQKNNYKKITTEIQFKEYIINQLPKFKSFNQKWHYSFQNHLKFIHAQFQQTSKITYLLENIKNQTQCWNNLKSGLKSDIKRAEKKLVIKDQISNQVFYSLLSDTFKKNNESIPFTFEKLHDIVNYVTTNNKGKVFSTYTLEGELTNSILVIWDHETAYYLLSGSEQKHKSLGGNSLLIWHSIKYVSEFVNQYDFEGSMLPGVESYVRAFGGKQLFFNELWKSNDPIKNFIKKILRR